MITVNTAEQHIFSTLYHPKEITIPFHLATGRVIAEDVVADRDFPPYDRVMMDGIAIRFEDFQQGIRSFRIAGLQAAGDPPKHLADAETCFEIMTGAMLASGCDTVVRYEDVSISNGMATINIDGINKGQHIHSQGMDRASGSLIIERGTKLTTAETGVLATVGRTHVKVLSLPKVLIVSTGDELVEVDQTPLPHQIRKSNVHALNDLCAMYGLESTLLHVTDNADDIQDQLKREIDQHDVVLLSGGVSKGKLDFIPDVLEKLGIQKHFHRVAQRPGKPLWFGSGLDTTVFAFPGNPVSTYMCAHRYLVPWLEKSLGLAHKAPVASLAADFQFKPELTYFLQVKLDWSDDARLLATPIPGQGSGDLANLVDTDAFMELPREKSDFKKGEVYPIYSFRS